MTPDIMQGIDKRQAVIWSPFVLGLVFAALRLLPLWRCLSAGRLRSHDPTTGGARVLLATAVSLAVPLAADAALVEIGEAAFPSTRVMFTSGLATIPS